VPDQPTTPQTPDNASGPGGASAPETQVPASTLGLNLPAGSVAADATTAAAPTTPKAPKGGGIWIWGTGRRKTAVARVRIKPGSGQFLVKKREVKDYFRSEQTQLDCYSPLKVTKTIGKYDIFVNVHGGGQMGQAGAIMLGVARALMKADPALEPILRDGKYLTRDSRKVERKKPGQPGARKRFQFSKR
jgi:small subunit ribosomal protein S9